MFFSLSTPYPQGKALKLSVMTVMTVMTVSTYVVSVPYPRGKALKQEFSWAGRAFSYPLPDACTRRICPLHHPLRGRFRPSASLRSQPLSLHRRRHDLRAAANLL